MPHCNCLEVQGGETDEVLTIECDECLDLESQEDQITPEFYELLMAHAEIEFGIRDERLHYAGAF